MSFTRFRISSVFRAHPLADHYVAKNNLDEQQEKFPLNLYLCDSCSHLQMIDIVNPEILFKNYGFKTSSSPSLVDHFRISSEKLSERINPRGFVVEIGSNDGTMLRFFRNKGHRVLGIDPAINIARKATESGIETLPEFFDSLLSHKIISEYEKASLVVANNVFAHIDNLEDVVQGVRDILAEDGVFTFEVSYLPDILDKMLFDTIYHEHLSYHSLKPLMQFLRRNGMEMFDVERISTKGGSIRGYVQLNTGKRRVSEDIEKLLENEKNTGLDRIDTFRHYQNKVGRARNNVSILINKIKRQGKSLAGYGISPTANTLLYHFRLGNDLDFIVDDNPSKQGLYTAGFHIPILPPAELVKSRPDYTFVLAWVYADQIIKRNQSYLGNGGKFITPLPQIKINQRR